MAKKKGKGSPGMQNVRLLAFSLSISLSRHHNRRCRTLTLHYAANAQRMASNQEHGVVSGNRVSDEAIRVNQLSAIFTNYNLYRSEEFYK